MKQTIEIEVPDGKKAVWKDNKVIFEDIKPQLPKTWKEYVTFHFPVDKLPENHYVCAETSIFSCHTTNSDYESVLQTKNILTSDKTIKQHLALMQLHQLRDCYRQGWEPDLADKSIKYCIEGHGDLYTRSINYQIVALSYISDFLSFPTRELAKEFLTNFRELIEQAGDLI